MSDETRTNPYEPYDNHDDEMKRIQDEIFKALQAAQKPQEPEPAQEPAAEPAAEILPPTLAPSYQAEPEQACYQETIKNTAAKKSGRKRLVAAGLAVCLLGGSLVGYLIGAENGRVNQARAQTAEPGGRAERDDPEPSETAADEEAQPSFAFKDAETGERAADVPDLRSMSDQFVSIIDKVEPSVVAITSSEVYSEDFLNQEIERDTGSASGIIFSEDDGKAFIVTNQHVIDAASRVYVSVEGSDPIPASHVGSDSGADMAVISVDKADMAAAGVESVVVAEFGDSDELQVGEIVLAIGNAFGQGNSSTMGLISAPEKELQVSADEPPLHVIQTSATINFGNSGGPLVNLDGQVIGINTAKISPQYGAESTGYAITSNRAKPIIEDFMNQTGRAFLGVSGFTVTPEVSAMYGLPEAGVFVNGVVSGTAAEKAGIVRTDIITSVNGQAIFTVEQLTETIQGFDVGDTIEVGVIRDGETPMSVEAKLEQYDEAGF